MFPTLLISMSDGVYTLATGARIASDGEKGKSVVRSCAVCDAQNSLFRMASA